MGEDDRDRLLLHALADGELDAATSIMVEDKIAGDPALSAEYERIRAVKGLMRGLERPAVSDALSARIAALARPVSLARRPKMHIADWRSMAASLVVGAALASAVTYAVVAPSASHATEDAIVSSHKRSLLAATPTDIASSERHTVRPWFDAKLGLSPPAPDLAAIGFPLVGGRIDVIGDRPVPSIVYRRKEHLISVMALPAHAGDDATSATVSSKAGPYNVTRWEQPGFRYWAVSDLDATELRIFTDALRAGGD